MRLRCRPLRRHVSRGGGSAGKREQAERHLGVELRGGVLRGSRGSCGGLGGTQGPWVVRCGFKPKCNKGLRSVQEFCGVCSVK